MEKLLGSKEHIKGVHFCVYLENDCVHFKCFSAQCFHGAYIQLRARKWRSKTAKICSLV